MKITVFGSTGDTGRAVVRALVAQGHQVSAFVRSEKHRFSLAPDSKGELVTLIGDVRNPGEVEAAIAAQEIVIVILGINENPLKVKLLGPQKTAMNIRSMGTQHILAAMKKHHVKRLWVQTTFGTGDFQSDLSLLGQSFYQLALAKQIADIEKQDQLVRTSSLDWTILQPVFLDNRNDANNYHYWLGHQSPARWSISRKAIATFLSSHLLDTRLVQKTVGLSRRVYKPSRN